MTPELDSSVGRKQQRLACDRWVRNQAGLAVLVMILVLLSGSLAHFLQSRYLHDTTLVSDTAIRMQRLNQAKQALIAYSVSYADNYLPAGAGPGHLPCPDRSPIDDGIDSNDGPDPPCSRAETLIGRFPRFTYSRDPSATGDTDSQNQSASKRLVFYAHRSLKDEQMWYAVSRTHVNNPANLALNPASEGMLRVDGHGDIVAVIIDPGPELTVNQGSRPGEDARAYLEGVNAAGDFDFTLPPDSTSSNDLLVTVTREELMAVVMKRVGLFVYDWLSEFNAIHCGVLSSVCYPTPANDSGICQSNLQHGYLPLYPGDCGHSMLQEGLLEDIEAQKHWFIRNGWFDFIRYNRDPKCELDISNQCLIRVSVNPSPIPLTENSLIDFLDASLIEVNIVSAEAFI